MNQHVNLDDPATLDLFAKALRDQIATMERSLGTLRSTLATVERRRALLRSAAEASVEESRGVAAAMRAILARSERPLSAEELLSALEHHGTKTKLSTISTLLSRRKELFERTSRGLYTARDSGVGMAQDVSEAEDGTSV